MKKILQGQVFYFIFCLAISIPIIFPYVHKGFFPTHDGEWAIVRLADMFRTVKDLQIPARYSDDLNFSYGYPLFNFVYPLPYYFGLIFILLKFGFVGTIKVIFALSVPLAAYCMFHASKFFWKSATAGLISATLYTYMPYRFVDLFVRGSIGESVAFILFPLLIFLFLRIAQDSKSIRLIGLAGAAFGMLIMTHNIMAILFLPILAFVFLGNLLDGKPVTKAFLFSFILGLGISSFFWIPAIFEKNTILLSKTPIADRSLYYVQPEQLLLPQWGYGTPTEKDAFTYQIGWPHLFIFVMVSIFFLAHKKNVTLNKNSTVYLFVICVVGMIFMLFRTSSAIWEHVPLFSDINYPWTLLAPIGFLLCVLAGGAVVHKYLRYMAIIVSALAVIMFLPYAKPSHYIDKGDEFYLTNQATTTSSNELMPLWVKIHPTERPKNKVEIIEGEGDISAISYNAKHVEFTAELSRQSTIRINTIYYPGWNVLVNNTPQEFFYNNNKGVMDLRLHEGKYQVFAIFHETTLRMLGNILSFVSVVIAFLYIVIPKKLSYFIRV